jgi:ABC-type multidrug transport system ATPase subunit
MLVYATMIEFQDVTRQFGQGLGRRARVSALAAVSCQIPAGRITAIVGPNGAGKSTLLSLVLGFLQPTAGLVLASGLPPRAYVRRHGASYLPERFTLPADWRVLRALQALARLEGLNPAQARERAMENANRYGLRAHESRRIGSLSKGLLQRVGLAQATLIPRQLVVFDEPTEGLDAEGRVLFRDAIATLRASSATVLIASHDFRELERLADGAILLEAGRVRETIELTAPETPTFWTLRLAKPSTAVAELFPAAVLLDNSDAGTESEAVRYAVSAAGAADMSARIAALLATGAILLEVSPAGVSLEERVRQSLQSTLHRTRQETT